jgi:arylsulfatase A-like enzyme
MRHCVRRDFVKALGAGLGAAARARAGADAGAPGSARPNIVIMLADDQRFDTIGALGNAAVKTPNLDALVTEGTTFTHAHTMGAMHGALCVPSRAMLMTGRTLFRLEKQGGVIPPAHAMLPEVLRAATYETYGIGKWHNDRASFARAFDGGAEIFFGGMADHAATPVFDFDPAGKYADEKQRKGAKFSSTLFADAAVKFLEERKSPTPFFLYVAFTAPHDPRMAPEEFARLYDPEKVALPPNFLPEHPFDNGELEVRDELLAPRPRTPEVVRAHIAAYYAMISHLDREVGRVLGALERTGRARDTLVVFAGDNGLAVGQHGLLGKQSVYEHSARVPLVMRGPGVPRGARRDALCYLLDVLPTLCDLLGIEAPATAEGLSLAPVLRGRRAEVRDSLFCAYRLFQRAVKRGDLKLITYRVKGVEHTQLFDLAKDPWETRNLADAPERAEDVRALARLLAEWQQRLDDPRLRGAEE